MSIINSVVHRLEKDRYSKSTVNLRESILEVSEPLENLLAEIRKVYNNKTGKSYGRFQSDVSVYPFSSYLTKHLDDEFSFIEFTKKAMNLFKNKIDVANLATGGYVLFIHYENYLMVVMLNDKSGISIDEKTLEVLDASHLDLEKLHLAARIDLDSWNNSDSQKYLSFVKGRKSSESVSLYFREFLGCTDYTDPKEQTQILLKVVDDFCNYKNYDNEDRQNYRQLVFDYCDDKRKAKQPVYLEDLSHHLNEEEPNEFLQFANSEEYSLNTGFELHHDTLQRLKRYIGKDNKLSIKFEAELLGDRIIYNSNEKSLLINKLPADLENQLDELYESSSI